MFLLSRTVRFDTRPGEPEAGDWGRAWNSFAGFPSMAGLGAHYELVVSCSGEVDPQMGYFLNIKVIDRAARETAIPILLEGCRARADAEAGELLRRAAAELSAHLGHSVKSLVWKLSPFFSVEVEAATMSSALYRQQFEFAASHRLHVPGLSDEENVRLFGKCNSRNGHGHNYRVEPCIEVQTGGGHGTFRLADLERIVHETIIERFDHKHLNEDTPEFRTGSGLNPSVENIARICFELLEPSIRTLGAHAALRNVTVWETDKTSCRYPS